MHLVETLVRIRSTPILGRVARIALTLLSVSIPPSVRIGENLHLPHGAPGLVVHQNTIIGNNVRLYQGVTLGRGDTHLSHADTRPGGGIVVEDDVILGAGAVALFRSGSTLTIGRGAVVGANAVVRQDIEPGEIWAGNPARRVGARGTTEIR